MKTAAWLLWKKYDILTASNLLKMKEESLSMKHETFRSVTGAELDKAVWEPDTAPKAVVQLVPGLCE